ncbi:MAG TPA: PRC-barrel domain-containing protein [Hyphomicrobiaceae bacterium]|nr:PRC-barrel domain-containing protein [Hyphomicrobiaceae bacterium]
MKWIVPAAASLALFATSAAFAQTTAPSGTPPATPPAATAPSVQPTPADKAPMLTEEQAKALIDATVLSSDDKNLGEVAAIQRDSEGKVTELQADIGGFLGIGETRVRVAPSQFTVVDNKVRLTLTAEQAKALPKIEKK